MTVIVSRAEVSQGPLLEGQVHYLVVPAVLGGKYVEDNIKKISLIELLTYSGDMAHQMDGLPEGAKVKLVVKK